jgi:hypothetical protein
MKNQDNQDINSITIHAPRNVGIFLIQWMSLSVLLPALMIATAGLPSILHASRNDRVVLLILLTVLLLVGFVMIYFPQRDITRLVFNTKTRSLTKLKRGDVPVAFDLSSAQQIVSKMINTNPGLRYSLIIEDFQGQTQIVFDEDCNLSMGLRWITLSKKLSHITGVPLKTERWYQDMNGQLRQTPASTVNRNLALALIPIIIAFVGAAFFRMRPSPRSFLYVGLATVALNIALTLIYAFFKKVEKLYVLTMVIPYIMFYLMFVFLLNGFRLPL